jgi:hypothetical protein
MCQCCEAISVSDPGHSDTDPDPYHWIADTDPALFFGGFKMPAKSYFFFTQVFLLLTYLLTTDKFTPVFKERRVCY